MALLVKRSIQGYFWIFRDIRDPRSDDYWLMSSPFVIMSIGAAYLYFVYKWGPQFMKDRKPYNLDNIIKFYNLLQVLANAFIGIVAFPYILKANKTCYPIDYSSTPEALFILKMCYFYFIIKVVDLLDTVFFILRKKFNQASFLHVYHHFGMIFLSWGGVKFLGGGHSIFLGYINALVHAFMYFYYFLSSLDEKYKKNVWWKKHITHLQLTQFFLLIVLYGGQLLHPNCPYPKFASYFILPQNIFMLALFLDFYRKAYLKQPSNKENNKIF